MHFEIDMVPNADQLKKEARERMEMLNMYPPIIDDFVNNGQLWTSSGCLRKPKPEELEHVRAFEKKIRKSNLPSDSWPVYGLRSVEHAKHIAIYGRLGI